MNENETSITNMIPNIQHFVYLLVILDITTSLLDYVLQ